MLLQLCLAISVWSFKQNSSHMFNFCLYLSLVYKFFLGSTSAVRFGMSKLLQWYSNILWQFQAWNQSWRTISEHICMCCCKLLNPKHSAWHFSPISAVEPLLRESNQFQAHRVCTWAAWTKFGYSCQLGDEDWTKQLAICRCMSLLLFVSGLAIVF